MVSWLIGRRFIASDKIFKAFLFLSLLPDIDIMALLLGLNFFTEFHGTISHTLVAIIPLSFVVSFLFSKFYRVKLSLMVKYGFAAIALHLLIDFLMNTAVIFKRGGALFWPFSSQIFRLSFLLDIPLLYMRIFQFSLFIVMVALFIHFTRKGQFPFAIWKDEVKIIIKYIKRYRYFCQ
jgi:hypothetical protein